MEILKRTLWVSSLFLCLFGSAALAQDRCGELLQQGIYDTWLDSSDVQERNRVHQALCRRHNSNRSSGASLGLNIPIKGVPLGIEFGASQVSSYGKAFCSDETTWNESLVQRFELRTIASQHVVNGYVECLRLVRQGVRYRVYYPQVGVGDLELEISKQPDGRLPVYKGLSITPEEAVSCAFVDQSDTLPQPGETLAPAFYHLRCTQKDLQANASVVVALDGASAMHLKFRGHGDLKSNEARALEGVLHALDGEVRQLGDDVRSEFVPRSWLVAAERLYFEHPWREIIRLKTPTDDGHAKALRQGWKKVGQPLMVIVRPDE